MSFVLVSDFLGNQLVIKLKNDSKIKWRGKKILKINKEILNVIPGYFKNDKEGVLVSADSEIS